MRFYQKAIGLVIVAALLVPPSPSFGNPVRDVKDALRSTGMYPASNTRLIAEIGLVIGDVLFTQKMLQAHTKNGLMLISLSYPELRTHLDHQGLSRIWKILHQTSPGETAELNGILQGVKNAQLSEPAFQAMLSKMASANRIRYLCAMGGITVLIILGADLLINAMVSTADAAELTKEDRLQEMQQSIQAYEATPDDPKIQQTMVHNVSAYLNLEISDFEEKYQHFRHNISELFHKTEIQRPEIQKLLDEDHSAYSQGMDIYTSMRETVNQLKIAKNETEIQSALEHLNSSEDSTESSEFEDFEERLMLATLKYGYLDPAMNVIDLSAKNNSEKMIQKIISIVQDSFHGVGDVSVGRAAQLMTGLSGNVTNLSIESLETLNTILAEVDFSKSGHDVWLKSRLLNCGMFVHRELKYRHQK